MMILVRQCVWLHVLVTMTMLVRQCVWLHVLVTMRMMMLCDIVFHSMCWCDEYLHKEQNTYTRREDLLYDQNMVTSMTLTSTCRSCLSSDEARWEWRLTWAHCVISSVCTHKVKLSKEPPKLDVMKPAQEKIEKIDQCLRIQPLRGGNLLYIT